MPRAELFFHVSWILTFSDFSWEAEVKNNTNHGSTANGSRDSPNANYTTKLTTAHPFPSRTVTILATNKSTVASATGSNPNRTTTMSFERELKLYGHLKRSRFNPKVWCSGEVDGCANMHVMCQYPKPGPSDNCLGYLDIPLREGDILKIIHYFNYRRNLVAGGYEYRLPPASGMMMLEWDGTLAKFAQRWADQCIFNPNILRDVTLLSTLTDLCRDLPGVAVAQVSTRIHGTRLFRKPLYGGFNAQVDNLVHLLIDTISSSFFNVTAHILFSGYVPGDDYGAVAFHSHAVSIGCGISSYILGIEAIDHRMTVMYCNIGPVNGLHLLDQYYKHGTPCSDCPFGTSCNPDSYFQYLCQTNSLLDDTKEIKHRSYHYSESDRQHSSHFLLIMVATLFFLGVEVYGV